MSQFSSPNISVGSLRSALKDRNITVHAHFLIFRNCGVGCNKSQQSFLSKPCAYLTVCSVENHAHIHSHTHTHLTSQRAKCPSPLKLDFIGQNKEITIDMCSCLYSFKFQAGLSLTSHMFKKQIHITERPPPRRDWTAWIKCSLAIKLL